MKSTQIQSCSFRTFREMFVYCLYNKYWIHFEIYCHRFHFSSNVVWNCMQIFIVHIEAKTLVLYGISDKFKLANFLPRISSILLFLLFFLLCMYIFYCMLHGLLFSRTEDKSRREKTHRVHLSASETDYSSLFEVARWQSSRQYIKYQTYNQEFNFN